VGAAGGGPERFMLGGEHPALAGLSQPGRPGQRTGFTCQNLQIVIQHHRG
jgi:hypothetical protein